MAAPNLTLALCLVALGACETISTAPSSEARSDASTATGDPRRQEVPLPALNGWRGSLVIDNGETGIWTVKPFQVFEQYACTEVVGLDDRGRCHVLVSYSGKWTPATVIEDGAWLGGLAHGDVDPRIDGAELYTGGKLGNLYQVVAYPHGPLDYRLIAHLPGREIHTVVAGDVDPRHAGRELLVFTRPGALYRVTPNGPHGTFETEQLEVLPGRVRDALLLPARPGRPREIATVSRAGRLELLTIDASGPRWKTIYSADMGIGRIAMRSEGSDGGVVLYTTHDDGRVLRHARDASGRFDTVVIYRGAQGPRGIAAGRFSTKPNTETIAIFGYSGRVELLTRTGVAFSAETIFVDRDKGHWLATAELDGRNDTDELLLSGYGGRVVLLSRPPLRNRPATRERVTVRR